MSCSISTSPATSGSIFTPSTFLWPSILTVTMPPPADASTRISAISCLQPLLHLLRLFHHGLHVSMLPGIFIRSGLLQVADGADFAAEQLSKALYFRIRERALGDLIVFRRQRVGAEPARRSLRQRLL